MLVFLLITAYEEKIIIRKAYPTSHNLRITLNSNPLMS